MNLKRLFCRLFHRRWHWKSRETLIGFQYYNPLTGKNVQLYPSSTLVQNCGCCGEITVIGWIA